MQPTLCIAMGTSDPQQRRGGVAQEPGIGGVAQVGRTPTEFRNQGIDRRRESRGF